MSVRRSFEIFLEAAQMEFKSFTNAESFLHGAKPECEDLLLLDINLPEISGLDLLNTISKENKIIPVIVVTALDDAKTRESCKAFGVKAFLRKPVDGGALIDMIKYYYKS